MLKGRMCADTRLLFTDGAKGMQDLETWISDFLKRRDCVSTMHDSAPLQALCRAQQSPTTCEGVNKACGDACGRPESVPFPHAHACAWAFALMYDVL